ncbi:MAG: bifunctional 5,10-methylenetetrahydrofolate dehydrogenase/5,10-methenyltetrahydrofolate cyclohydrolase [Pseudomonadaceae bacterium]|nr:bifunctional 5,10-methylenetetrahydrofolate dehydrogenase/5,10-methenyltetrahydrofolate cyclohydrolase [Pseudomonadaceae bacterium]
MHQAAPSCHVATRRLPGAPLRAALAAQVPAAVAALPAPPKLVVVRVGDDPASKAFVGHKLKLCAGVGLPAEELHLRADEAEATLHATLRALADDDAVQAVILQLPLPAGWQVDAALNLIPPHKDCDGLTAANIAARQAGHPHIAPATPLGVMRLLASIPYDVRGKHVAVIGKGRVAGQPMREMLEAAGATVTAIDRDTPTPATLTSVCDVVIAAAGVPHLVNENWLKPGALVVDIGLTRVEGNGQTRLLGDVDAMKVEGVAAYLTPVPGGVGPLTVASLLTNVVDCARLQAGLPPFAWQVPLLDSSAV